jgi:hypothetical protein
MAALMGLLMGIAMDAFILQFTFFSYGKRGRFI